MKFTQKWHAETWSNERFCAFVKLNKIVVSVFSSYGGMGRIGSDHLPHLFSNLHLVMILFERCGHCEFVITKVKSNWWVQTNLVVQNQNWQFFRITEQMSNYEVICSLYISRFHFMEQISRLYKINKSWSKMEFRGLWGFLVFSKYFTFPNIWF